MTDPLAAVRRFWSDRSKLDAPNAARFYSAHTQYDQQFIEPLVRPGARILDLGAGACEIANWLVAEHGAAVHAVDGEAEFLSRAIDHPALTVEQAYADEYAPAGRYTGVLLLGIIQYLMDPPGRERLYQRLHAALDPDGFIVIKSQFGIAEDVVVDRFSEALGTHYCCTYPHLDGEVQCLSNLFEVEVVDLYPPEFSPHTDTHFYHLIGRPRAADSRS